MKIALIVAGGSGKRMGSSIPKQFLEIAEKPILLHTLAVFEKICEQIVLVLPQSEFEAWQNICEKHQYRLKGHLVTGGETRYQSVKNGLKFLVENKFPQESLVAIHDGVRPFVKPEVIEKSFEIAQKNGSAVASVPLKDSIRRLKNTLEQSESLPREQFRLIQTPQTFVLAKIWQAFQQVPDTSLITDDASVFEQAGFSVTLIEGNYENIKITTPEDLQWAEILVKK
ncbi:2-C-methyl-D-erythritol 4-phosphate cytidylyltransferase [Raineya orbicola]|uniref:2-C-methyl-D-erythritol 4-phosphate cytidylyltransferase n=1 Tax=Raineya orbicola TaxID=2016530 RepID=A0A2N3IHU0_9BACT|nr:2-C-methyl-D-erythritol 4-phosphate cytidylyltransferase [Raineya orbicola]PKQ69851.1 ispD: 2-C-methyl-D-erythritol 4-phosphate cytidylyltransferase [Raineya orbicola]